MDRREFSAALFASCIAWRSTNVETVKLLQGDRLGPEAALGPAAGPTAVVSEPLYQYDKTKWLYIGCENDHPKSWTFMGGGLAPDKALLFNTAFPLEIVITTRKSWLLSGC